MKQQITKTAKIAMAKALAKSTILKQKTVTYTKTKFIVTKEFMKFVATDPMFQGVGITVGIASGAAGILSFGHQLYFSSTVPLTQEQVEALLNKNIAENLTEEQKIAVVHSLGKSHVIIEQSDNNCHTLDYWKIDEANNLFKLKTETITKPRWKSWLGLYNIRVI